MITAQTNGSSGGDFLLSKWFLDFVGDEGEAMIFYAAKLKWHGWSVSYASWLRYNPASGVLLKSRFQNVSLPVIEDNLIIWNDPRFGVSGTWRSMADRIKTRLFDSEEGCVEWNCYQPASKVQLKIKDKILNGRGYAEQLIMTVLPWKIPMDELRWGRFGSENMNMVWIELVGKENPVVKQQMALNNPNFSPATLADKYRGKYSYAAEVYQIMPGFTVGGVINARLGRDFDLRFTPGMSLGNRHFKFIGVNASETQGDSITYLFTPSAYVDLPLGIRYKGFRHRNLRPYIYAGAAYRQDLENKSKSESVVHLRRGGGYAELALGLDSYLEYFRFTAEFRFSYGLNNLIRHDIGPDHIPYYGYIFKEINSNIFTLIFYFE